jgi:hypothetical protein
MLIHDLFVRIQMRIQEARKHTDPDPDADPEHWQKVKRSHKTVEIKVFLTIFAH